LVPIQASAFSERSAGSNDWIGMSWTRTDLERTPVYPLWATLPYTALTLVIIPVYWIEYTPANFLWFSDIALFALAIAMWTGNRLLYSMMAVGVLPLELIWTIDILTMGELLGLAAYMFDEQYPLWLRALSLFHLPVLAILIWMLFRQGYDRRAFWPQTILAWIVLPLSWWLTEPGGPAGNVNWVHGFGPDGQELLPPLAYLFAYMALLPLLVYLPTHFILRRLFGGNPSEHSPAWQQPFRPRLPRRPGVRPRPYERPRGGQALNRQAPDGPRSGPLRPHPGKKRRPSIQLRAGGNIRRREPYASPPYLPVTIAITGFERESAGFGPSLAQPNLTHP
jgi:hypothetical protein